MHAVANIRDMLAQERDCEFATFSRSKRRRIGKPARIRATNCWLKTMKSSVLIVSPSLPAAERKSPAARTHGHGQEPLFLKPVPDVLCSLSNLDRLDDLAGRLRVLDDEFHSLL